MQPTLAVQNIQQGTDAPPLSAHAVPQNAGDFKAILASEIAGAGAPADPKSAKADKDSGSVKTLKDSGKDQPPNQPVAPPILAMPVLPGHTNASVEIKSGGDQPAAVQSAPQDNGQASRHMANTTLTAKTDKTSIPAAALPAQALPEPGAKTLPDGTRPPKIVAETNQPASALSGNTRPQKILSDGIKPSKPTDASGSPSLGNAGESMNPAKLNRNSNPANFAPTGNNLPPASVKATLSQVTLEKPVLPETRKISENQTTQVSLQQLDTAQQSSQTAPHLTVESPVASPAWAPEVGQKIAWMSVSNHHVAELHLNPPNLGPLEVKLSVHNNQATVQFISHQHEVRAALESAMPRLREMLMGNGIALGNATVDSGAFQQSAFSQQDNPRRQSAFLHEPLQQMASPALRVSRLLGKVDTFA